MDEWTEKISKRNKKNKSTSESSEPNFKLGNGQKKSSLSISHFNERNENTSFEMLQHIPANVSRWMEFIMDGKIEKFIDITLTSLSMKISGPMNKLWDALLQQLKEICPNDSFKFNIDLKTDIYNTIESDKKLDINKKNFDIMALDIFCKKYNVQLNIYSIIKELKDIRHGFNPIRSIHLLHIGFDNFFPLTQSHFEETHKCIHCDKQLLSKLNELKRPNEISINQKNINEDNKNLEKFRQLLKNMEMVEEYDHNVDTSKKHMFYKIYSAEQLNKMKDLILCTLTFINAHSGKAIPIERTSDMKFKEILLNSRSNCGYNAFENDIVYVQIHDKVKPTGKVMGVLKSDHKPVNKIYICKVSRDQGSLMSPLDKSIPKIHVDNNPGRRYYETTDASKASGSLCHQQKTILDREKESARYADNLYYSQFKITVKKNNNKPCFSDPIVQMFNPEICEKFFIVVYEYWDPHFMYPTGKIIGTLSSYDSLKDNYSLISTLCGVEPIELNEKYKKEVKEIKNKVSKLSYDPNSYIPSTAMVFTIDDESTEDLDDALSYHKEGKEIVIGVHISDVSKYVTSTQEIYKQAEKRIFTSYPPKFAKIIPNHILDKELAVNCLSLLPDQPRSVVSVFFRFNETMLVERPDFKLSDIKNPDFKEGIIQSKYKLNYNEVTSQLKKLEISTNGEKSDLLIALFDIYKIAKRIRRARLPESYFIRSLNTYNKDFQIENQFEAHILIEEFMLLANEYVAKKVYERFPNNTLLRMQDPVSNYENWIERLFEYTNMNFSAQLKEYCNLLKINKSNKSEKKPLVISRRFYDNFCKYLESDIDKAKNLLQHDVLYNEFFVHITGWYELSKSARYDRSVLNCHNNGHFSLNKPLYTHFTSPIRRFTDVIVHRFLKSIIHDVVMEDESIDIDNFCLVANKKSKDNKNFEKMCAPFAIFEETNKKYCFILDCVCINIDNEELRLAHPILQKAASVKALKFASLSLNQVPFSLMSEENVYSCIFKWKKIIFTYSNYIFEENMQNNKFIIDTHLYDSFLPHSDSKLFREIRRSYQPVEKLKSDLYKLRNAFKLSDYETNVTSDCFSSTDSIINIEIQIFIKNTLRVQFCKYKVNGLPKISPELYIITPTFQICLIHQDDPVRFFIPGGKLKLKYNNIKKAFDSISEYKEYFEPLIYVESLVETLAENAAFTLINVPILWIIGSSKTLKKQRYGVIMLSYKFCKSRNIIFSDENDVMVDRLESIIHKGITSVGGDLLCLRYKNDTWNNYWIGHGEVLNVGKYRNNLESFKVIVFILTQCDYDSFTNLEESGYTVDVYLKSVVSKRQQQTLASVDLHPLLKDVILGNQISSNEMDSEIINEIIFEIENKRNFRLNRNQREAINKAMNEKLSLIWGPPGTGKTHIGCILSYGFAMKNKRRTNYSQKPDVVLYCGPSNDCVNLVGSEMQKKFGENCPKLLRIYGEQQELADFPLPGFFVKNNLPLTGEMQNISLHHLVRMESDALGQSLRNFDSKFHDILNSKNNVHANKQEDIHSAILTYRETLKEAKIKLIEKNRYDMILCTTSVTATSIMKLFNVSQIIIDEAGMCKEPETLIPISGSRETVKNVVLIGDHKQLRPIIRSKIANKRGLQISLFERYQELRPDLVTMLNFQYRMHPSICKFPSKEFYNNQLQTIISQLWSGLGPDDININYRNWNGYDYNVAKPHYKQVLRTSHFNVVPNDKWPAAKHNPQSIKNSYPERLVFIHVVGDEIIQSVTTSTGNENSRGNQLEVEATGHIYEKLISRFEPPRYAPAHVTVLTQYKLQQSLIKSRCKDILHKKNLRSEPLVSTVIRSQGSENDYIIFSTVRSIRNKEDINDNPTPGWEKQYLGFISDPNQINVALTRAKKGLIIIGNSNLLKVNKIWDRLIIDLKNRNCFIDSYLDFLNF